MICSSVNRDRFIIRLLQGTDSTHSWRNFRGAGHANRNTDFFNAIDPLRSYQNNWPLPESGQRGFEWAGTIAAGCTQTGATLP
jgi:hypothetical protein